MSQLGTDIRGFLCKLLKDRAGNTLAIVAASTLPLLALVGGGVDISRGYMAKTQLQAACDAGVLAGRRAMAKSGEYSTKERAKADAMFNFNFDKSSVQANGDKTTFVTEDNDEGQVTGTATTEVPTSVMYLFGKEQMDLSVECMAELQLANVDVMFVLDSTGSMADPISGGGTKIEGLRAAVNDFHNTIVDAVTDQETRVRYAFVPYSTTVNARRLITDWSMPTTYFTDKTPYQSRTAVFDTKDYITDYTTTDTKSFPESSITKSSDCTSKSKSNTTTGTKPSPTAVTSYKWTWGSSKCTRTETTVTTYYKEVYYFTNWNYRQSKLDTSTYRSLGSASLATGFSTTKSYVTTKGEYKIDDLAKMTIPSMTTTNYTWNGCVEERDTVAETSFDPIPSGAHDLDLETEPTDDVTRWKPQWLGAIYTRAGSKVSNGPCPSPMLLFQEVVLQGSATQTLELDAARLNTYLNSLIATGNTYHDIGMIWGGILSSPKGVFEDNVNEGDEEAVSRHLIFMTDGIMEPNRDVYTAYGVEAIDNRIAASGTSNSTLATIHTKRFRAVCDAVKAQGYTIYVISFGTSLTNDLKYCSSGGRAYQSNNTTQLRNTFKFIASQVADLRLGK